MKIIGLDIGSYSVKVLEIEVGLRQVEILAFYEQPVSAEGNQPRPLKEVLQNLFTKYPLFPPFKVVASLEGKFVSSRFLTLPFIDKAKIAQALPFELEEHIPFSLDQIIFDFQISTTQDKQSKVLVLLAPKENIKERLELCEEAGLLPDILTTDAIAFHHIATFPWAPSDTLYAIVDIGHTQTSLCIIEEGGIRHLRTLLGAGKSITEAIQTDYQLSYEEAENAKIENGFVLTQQKNVTPDQLRFSDCIKQALDPLVTQINQTFQSTRSKGHGIVKKIFLTGGTSLLRNIGGYFSEELQVEVEPLRLLNQFEMNNIAETDENNAKASTALALSLGFVGHRASEHINFRKGEFSKTLPSLMRKEMKTFIRMGGLIVLILFFNIIGNTIILRSSARKTDRALIEMSQKFPVKIPSELLQAPLAPLEAYLNKVEREHKEKIKALGGEKGETLTLLEVIKEISSIVPKEVLFDVRDLTMNEKRITIKAIADSFNSIDTIEKSFKKNPYFTAVSKREISTAVDGANKEFTLTFDVRGK